MPLVNPRNVRSLAAWIPVTPGDAVGIVGAYPPLSASLERAGARIVALPVQPHDGTVPDRLAHLVIPDAAGADAWLASGVIARHVRPGGTVLVGVPHRWRTMRRGGWSAAGLARWLSSAGISRCRVLGVSHNLSDLRALVPLAAPTARWYGEHAFLPRSYREALAIRLLCRLGGRGPLRAMFPVLIGVGPIEWVQ
jgi:hypothetical protein